MPLEYFCFHLLKFFKKSNQIQKDIYFLFTPNRYENYYIIPDLFLNHCLSHLYVEDIMILIINSKLIDIGEKYFEHLHFQILHLLYLNSLL